MTERIYSTKAYERAMKARVVEVDRDDGRVLLDRTVFYPVGEANRTTWESSSSAMTASKSLA